MKLSNTFTVARPIDEMWPVLCDIERIAPCMPGAQLHEVEGDEYRGEVKIKVGPINARFRGAAQVIERDDDAHRAVLKAKGRDTGGKGNAAATITASAEADGGSTVVTIDTDLSITGKVAQFGRGALADVSTKLLGQFVNGLETRVLGGESAPRRPEDGVERFGTDAPVGGSPPTDGGGDVGEPRSRPVVPRTIDSPEAEPLDLFDAAGGAVAKRAVAPVLVLMAALLTLWWLRHRGRRLRAAPLPRPALEAR